MFTIEQIKTAHSKVKSGADFPAYIQEIKALGVTHYESYVTDGHTDYHGADDFTAATPSKYDENTIAEIPDAERFKAESKAHQQGKTDYLTCCKQSAETGIEKRAVAMEQRTRTYYDKAGHEIVVEQIPSSFVSRRIVLCVRITNTT